MTSENWDEQNRMRIILERGVSCGTCRTVDTRILYISNNRRGIL